MANINSIVTQIYHESQCLIILIFGTNKVFIEMYKFQYGIFQLSQTNDLNTHDDKISVKHTKTL